MKNISLYIHIPWCVKKCPYCDFNSHTAKDNFSEHNYIDALLSDLDHDLNRFNQDMAIQSIFIGGGTPSLFSAESYERLLAGINHLVELKNNLEITLEANPGTVDSVKFSEFRQLGINRLSIGIQSFDDHQLRNLGRIHSSKEAIRAIEHAQNAGFANFNLDLMYGLPKIQSHTSEKDIKLALEFQPTHLSFYQLTLEPNTLFYVQPPKLPKDDFIFQTQLRCQELLAENGWIQYEISAYSRNGYQCQHNLNYWRFGDYLGIGAGAHGKISQKLPIILRTSKSKNPQQYLKQPCHNKNITIEIESIPLEFMMNHLRLKEGFTLAQYSNVTGLSAETLNPGLISCMDLGLIVQMGDKYVCSEQGWNFLDNILEKFIH